MLRFLKCDEKNNVGNGEESNDESHFNLFFDDDSSDDDDDDPKNACNEKEQEELKANIIFIGWTRPIPSLHN